MFAKIPDGPILNAKVAMVRRILHFIALVVLVLAGPAQGMFVSGAPQASCCCGADANPGKDLGPCGMPKAPCPPRCPQSGASQAIQAPAASASQRHAAQEREASRRKEPAPWPTCLAQTKTLEALLPAMPSHGPPPAPGPGRLGDPQAGLCQFRI